MSEWTQAQIAAARERATLLENGAVEREQARWGVEMARAGRDSYYVAVAYEGEAPRELGPHRQSLAAADCDGDASGLEMAPTTARRRVADLTAAIERLRAMPPREHLRAAGVTAETEAALRGWLRRRDAERARLHDGQTRCEPTALALLARDCPWLKEG